MTLPDFRNEQDFRDNWVAPFLNKLGFFHVKNNHGTAEQGKDFFFADYDRFGHIRVCAAQVKLGNIGSGDMEIARLREQVRKCFEVRLRFTKLAHEQRIASVYVMTNGTISPTAKECIHEWCVVNHFGENVFFLDGEQLENKERFATFENDQDRRRLLTGLKRELRRNEGQLRFQQHMNMESNPVLPLYRVNCLETALQWYPSDGDSIDHYTMDQLWVSLMSFTHIRSPTPLKWEESGRKWLQEATRTALEHVRHVITYCDRELALLNSKYSLDVVSINAD